MTDTAKPSVCRMVHYVSYGTPGGEFGKECRAAVIAGLKGDDVVELVVLNPTGLFFHDAAYHDGAGEPGDPNCPSNHKTFSPCPCGWTEGSYQGGTWHWPEVVK